MGQHLAVGKRMAYPNSIYRIGCWRRIAGGYTKERCFSDSETEGMIPVSRASASQCLACGRRRPARISAAYDSQTPSVAAISAIVTEARRD